ncbi:hypothetical protein ACWCV2_15490 [Streptomyces pseudogriseolus]|uniref:hypothetical protein n=1 Tax=Streptomyces pseudogriseolus TaxID=36817 RepID=UPI003FA2AE0A
MATYERRGDDHEVVETVITVDGSPRDEELSRSKLWQKVPGEEQPTATAEEAEPKRRTSTAKPPAKEA